ELYRHAVDLLVRLHLKATFPANPACLAFGRAFDVPLLMWEFDHFIEYGIEKRAGKVLPEKDRHAIRSEMRKIASVMAAQPRVFSHRDYHSINLIAQSSTLAVFDFPD